MSKKIGWLIVIISLINFSLFSQEVSLPKEILPKIVDELIIKDNLVYKVNLQDSTIRAYEHRDSLSTVEIQKYKLGEKQYLIMIELLRQELKIVESENKDLKRVQTRLKIKSTVIQTLEAVALAVLIWLNFKD